MDIHQATALGSCLQRICTCLSPKAAIGSIEAMTPNGLAIFAKPTLNQLQIQPSPEDFQTIGQALLP